MNKEEKRFFIGDMVRDIFLIPQGDDPETLGIIIHIDIGFFKKEHEHPIASPSRPRARSNTCVLGDGGISRSQGMRS